MENSVLTGKPYNIGYALSGGFMPMATNPIGFWTTFPDINFRT